MWLQNLIGELGFFIGKVTQIWCDSSNSIKIANNLVFHAQTKHIEVHYHFIREKLLIGEIELNHIPISDQVADIFTKPLGKQKFLLFQKALGLCSLQQINSQEKELKAQS
jgi:hypothetical protein